MLTASYTAQLNRIAPYRVLATVPPDWLGD
jgi:hypothetical protein